MLCLLTLIPLAIAEPDNQSDAHHRAVLINPMLPLMATVNGLVTLTPIDDYFKVRALNANLRGLYSINERWGVMAQLELTHGEYMFGITHAGAKLGPRISIGSTGLKGWSLSPFLLGGITTISAGQYTLARWGVIGAGTELGYGLVWRQLILELGVGLYSSTNIGYNAPAQAFKGGSAPTALSTIKPALNIGMGYAF